MSDEVQVAVLTQKMVDFERLVLKLDETIIKMSEVNTNVSRVLGIHEERISQQEKIDEVLFDKIDKLRDKIDDDHNQLLARINFIERKDWMAIGAITVLSLAINGNTNGFLKKMLSGTQTADRIERVQPLVRELS